VPVAAVIVVENDIGAITVVLLRRDRQLDAVIAAIKQTSVMMTFIFPLYCA
jgi:hypothetical protein